MMTKNLKLLIKQQKIAARRSIAKQNAKIARANSHDQFTMFKIIADERRFLDYSFGDLNSIDELMEVIHNIRHNSINIHKSYLKCNYCKTILAELPIELPGAPAQEDVKQNEEDKIKLRFGHLVNILEQEVQSEFDHMQRKRVPSQNDLTRWALKDATLEFYKDFNEPEDTIIVDNVGDDRLSTQFEADFDVIYRMWLERLDELRRRDDTYSLQEDEYDKAISDMAEGMRGSNFEKQLDRYRIEFMNKLNVINGM